MKTVLILRHAKSSWEFDDLADHDRPLKSRGKEDAEKMGLFIRDKDLAPQRIISSTAARARKTAQFVADACDFTRKSNWMPQSTTLNRKPFSASCTIWMTASSA